MKYSAIVKEIRNRTNLSQKQLADALGVSFATVNRWENNHSNPTPIVLKGLRTFCKEHHIDYSEFEGNSIYTGDTMITLYHGSKSGIRGAIAPISRTFCDFGKGFYMGTEKNQPLTLICNFPEATLYSLEVDLRSLKILEIEVGIDWALLIAFNRGKMESIQGTSLYEKYKHMADGVDIIVGYIANDRMFVVLDRFFSGEITDVALINSLSTLKLGKQYVAITEKACRQIQILNTSHITESERQHLRLASKNNRIEGIAKAEAICKKHRRDGRFFDEIIDGGE